MTAKPNNPVTLKKGMLLDVQDGFVDTFNWMRDTLDALTPKGSKVETLTVVTGAEYDSNARQLVAKTKKVKAIVLGVKETSDTIFEAVPLGDQL